MQHAEAIVGVPFFEAEAEGSLAAALSNIDTCLNNVNIDASIVVVVNGPETAQGNAPRLTVEHSRYNSEIRLLRGERLGQANAINDIAAYAGNLGLSRVFITDADISRFPHSMQRMLESADKPLVGAQYAAYPLEIVSDVMPNLSSNEKLLYQVFEGDKSFSARRAQEAHNIIRPQRVKGSLMLLDVGIASELHDGPEVAPASDSVINRLTGADQTMIAEDAYFMHWGRVDLTDHIKARLRHYRAAVFNNNLQEFLQYQVSVPLEKVDIIASDIRMDPQGGMLDASLYLLRNALRRHVETVCMDIATGREPNPFKVEEQVNPFNIMTFDEAILAVRSLMSTVRWKELRQYTWKDTAITQTELPRVALDLSPYITKSYYRDAILKSLGITDREAIL